MPITIADFLKKDFNLDYLVEPIIPANQINLITGSTQSLKTTLTLSIVKSALRGEKWQGFQTKTIDRAIYINRDDPGVTLKSQLKRLGFNDTDKLTLWTLAEDPEPPAFKPENKETYIQLAKQYPLLIFDALAMFSTGKDENTVKDTSEAMDVLRGLTNHSTVILIHHSGKTRGSKIARGSTHLTDSAHVVLHLEKPRDDILHLTCWKSKVAPISRDQYLDLRYDSETSSFVCKGWKNGQEQDSMKMLKVISELQNPSQKDILENAPFSSKGYMKFLLKEYEGELWTKERARGNKYVYCPTGRGII